jgi:TetR/AcrR family transcriptional repressor of mexJK operon
MQRVVTATGASGTGRPVSPKAVAILEAARHVFLAHGYGDASMDAIARRAGVSKATLYAHFEGKEQLFAAIVAAECQRLSLQMELAGTEGLELGQALRQIGRSFLGLVTSTQGLGIYRIVVAEAARFPELGRVFYESGPSQAMDRLAEFIAAARDRGELAAPEPRRAAGHFIGLLRGEIHLRCVLGLAATPDGLALDTLLEEAIGAFLRAYTPCQAG